MTRSRVASVLAASVLAPCAAQCGPSWVDGYGFPGVAGTVAALVPWDPDGAGPLPEHVVAGGTFSHAGDVDARNVAAWNPVARSWLALPPPPGDAVTALVVLPAGELVAATFDQTLPTPAARVLRWSGSGWTQLGGAFDQRVAALHVRGSGELVAGGWFTGTASAPGLGGIATWTGAAWGPLGSGMPGGAVYALATLPNGELVASGSFAGAGGAAGTSNIARWTGSAWAALGNGASAPVLALATAGHRLFAGLTTGLAEWSGGTWSSRAGLAASPPLVLPAVHALTVRPGQLVVSGQIGTAGGLAANGIAALDLATGTWNTLGSGLATYTLPAGAAALATLGNGDVVAGGGFHAAGGLELASIAHWDGIRWRALGDGPLRVACVLPLDDTRFVAGGQFGNVGDVLARNVVLWTGTGWQPMGLGLGTSPLHAVSDLELLPAGGLVAAGTFPSSGPTTARGLALWNGGSWVELGGGLSGASGAVVLELLGNGDLAVGGTFASAGGWPFANIAAWRGNTWRALGAGLPAGVRALARTGAAGVIAVTVAGEVWRWDGAVWSLRASYGGNDEPHAAAELADGTLVVTGITSLFGGSSYRGFVDVLVAPGGAPVRTQLGERQRVDELVPLPDGSLLAPGLGRVRAGGVLVPTDLAAGVLAARFFPGGDLLGAGAIEAPGPAFHVGRLRSSCPATALASGTGCTGSGGLNVLVPRALPWLGSTFRAQATGLPVVSLAVGVRGFVATAVPLAPLLPPAGVQCTLLVTPDVLDAYVPASGSLTTQLTIPATPALVGAVFHEQVVALELSGSGIVAVTSTNRLTLTLGAF